MICVSSILLFSSERNISTFLNNLVVSTSVGNSFFATHKEQLINYTKYFWEITSVFCGNSTSTKGTTKIYYLESLFQEAANYSENFLKRGSPKKHTEAMTQRCSMKKCA